MATKKRSKAVEKPARKAKASKPKARVEDLQTLLHIDHLALYSTKCKRCGHLDPDEKRKFTACHFDKGNTLCPASEVRIVVVGQATSYARQVRKARDERNPQEEARLMAYVSRQSVAFQSKFYSALESKE